MIDMVSIYQFNVVLLILKPHYDDLLERDFDRALSPLSHCHEVNSKKLGKNQSKSKRFQ